ncbi:PQQ-dependent sugar dehydrogenase [Oceanicaulis sp. LC35]|uniref:PQQ-dependent sugar dehydrogenase n=1 Tax=Oceanicaulis sp. LC35 TaxID=3349635 RepID=UPI003F829ECF
MVRLTRTGIILTALAPVFGACTQAPDAAPPATDLDPALYQVEVIAEGLATPWDLAFLPNGSALVSERNGGVKWLRDGALSDVPGGPDDVFAEGQAGLFDLALSPDFETSGLVFLSYASGTADANTPALYRARLEDGALVEGETIFRAEPMRSTSAHYGARLAFLPDGTLLMTAGEGFAYREQAQVRTNHLGALLRLNPDGSAPADNPFADEGGLAAYVFSYGHRNMQGIALDEASGAIWTHEHGPQGGDELNAITPGDNYGWPIATMGLDYNGARISPYFEHDGFHAPAWVWTPSIAPSGMALYEGDLFADWQGDLLVTALAGQALHRLDLEAGAVVGEERLLHEREQRIRQVISGPDGAIWLLAESPDGQILRLTPSQ